MTLLEALYNLADPCVATGLKAISCEFLFKYLENPQPKTEAPISQTRSQYYEGWNDAVRYVTDEVIKDSQLMRKILLR